MVTGEPHQGGASWAVLQYVLGLRRLGHDVLLVEPIGRVDPAASESAAYLESVAGRFDLQHVTLVDAEGESAPIPKRHLRELTREADLLRGEAPEPAALEDGIVSAQHHLQPLQALHLPDDDHARGIVNRCHHATALPSVPSYVTT